MKLVLNGEDREVVSTTVSALIEEIGLANTRVAVELNRTIVRRAAWPETPVKDGDTIEIVHFVGGG